MTQPTALTPTGIGVPAEVSTRLGVLRFFDGVPDEATAGVLYDNLDFQRAVHAYLLGLPALDMARMRKSLLEWGPANTTLAIWEDLVYPRTVMLTANTSTLTALIAVDLHDGPLVVEAPPGVLGAVNDAWARWVVDVGVTGPDQGRGGAYLLLPPGYEGDVPDGFYVVRARTYGNLLFMRGFRDEHGDPRPAVEGIKARTRAYPLGRADGAAPMRFVNLSPEPFVAVPSSDERAWEILHEVVQSEPPEASDPLTLGFLASIGIRKAEPFVPTDRLQAILAEAAAVGDATARTLTYRCRDRQVFREPDGTWRTFFVGGYRSERDGVALLDGAVQCYFGGMGVSPAEDMEVVGAGSQYVVASVDADGDPFNGGQAYRLHLPAPVPAKDFWSIVVYDTQTRSMLQTAQAWPSATSQDAGIAVNEDGSVDIDFGPEPPTAGGNWVQTVPGKSWWAMFRLYGPLEAWFDRSWKLPDIERLP
jgi:hypothetical protein